MTPYGEKAMVQEVAELRSAPEGDRNNSLNKAAYTLAQLIGKGHLDESELVSDLKQAAEAIGLESREADQTIKSALRRGRQTVRGPEPGEMTKQTGPRPRPLVMPGPREPDWDPAPTGFAPPDPWQEKARLLVDYAQTCLFRDPTTTAWLASRGISEIAAKAYRLGWLPGEKGKDMFRPRSSWGLPAEHRADGSDKPLWIPTGLVIPWTGIDGIHRIRIRRTQGDPRYYVIPGSEMGCFMMPRDYHHRAYLVVESELDAIMLDIFAGDLCGIVALGNSTRKPDQRVWSALSQAARVLISLDNDPAGDKASGWWIDRLPRARVHRTAAGKDPGEAYEAGVDIREWVKAGLPEGWK